ncbi:MAG: phosphoribosyl-AMP cyclohydrolase [Lentisphaerae bacterium]|nr:phosphoribosyl-AMP cyclohydrolase [Lentisphaerota bacterium]
MSALEESNNLALNFGKIAATGKNCPNVIPVAIQNIDTQEVILIAYTNEIAMKRSFQTRTLILWSTSRNEIWEKGKTSGETYAIMEAYVNCEQNSLLYKVRPRRGGICHTKNRRGEPRNCFYRRIDMDTLKLENIDP